MIGHSHRDHQTLKIKRTTQQRSVGNFSFLDRTTEQVGKRKLNKANRMVKKFKYSNYNHLYIKKITANHVRPFKDTTIASPVFFDLFWRKDTSFFLHHPFFSTYFAVEIYHFF